MEGIAQYTTEVIRSSKMAGHINYLQTLFDLSFSIVFFIAGGLVLVKYSNVHKDTKQKNRLLFV